MKKIISLTLVLVMVLSLFTGFAHAEDLKAGQQYQISSNKTIYNAGSRGYVVCWENDKGEPHQFVLDGIPVLQVNGEPVYNLQPYLPYSIGDTVVPDAEPKYTQELSDVQRDAVDLILSVGYPLGRFPEGLDGDSKYVATQLIIWEVICGYRTPDDLKLVNEELADEFGIENGQAENVTKAYKYIDDALKGVGAVVLPSFTSPNKDEAPHIGLKYNEKENVYEAELEDFNKCLDQFYFENPELKFTRSGSKLKISIDAENASFEEPYLIRAQRDVITAGAQPIVPVNPGSPDFAHPVDVNTFSYTGFFVAHAEKDEKLPFKDVEDGKWYSEPVRWAYMAGVTSGTSPDTFSPFDPCTRGQIVTFLWRVAGQPAPKSSKNPFKDVKSKAYCYNAVLWAVENGITNGTSATTFEPDAKCTRAQIVTFLWRYRKSLRLDTPMPFRDIPKGSYYEDAVKWAVASGVTNGKTPDTFAPNDKCNRAEAVTFLLRVVDHTADFIFLPTRILENPLTVEEKTGLIFTFQYDNMPEGLYKCELEMWDMSTMSNTGIRTTMPVMFENGRGELRIPLQFDSRPFAGKTLVAFVKISDSDGDFIVIRDVQDPIYQYEFIA